MTKEEFMTGTQFVDELRHSVETLDIQSLAGEYWRQDEFLFVRSFLPPSLGSVLQREVPHLRPFTHRTNIPRVRKGGAVEATVLRKHTACIREVYTSVALMNFLSAVVRRPLLACGEDDEHAMALYSYTEEGDFIHYHYDTSFYKGNRYTMLLTIENNSSCKLLYDLYRRSKHHPVEHHELKTPAGSLVLFNGNKLYHAVSPALKNEQRHVLSLEYLDNKKIGALGKIISELKDQFGYFGVRRGKVSA